MKPKVWRLFHYINQDYVRSYQIMHVYAINLKMQELKSGNYLSAG
ncbi:hypothetical protein [Xenorhabdus hominickii]|nr:hypothetical protein [Xenorhabdus hominickii]